MLTRESWLPLADQVPDGQSRRLNHDCGGGRTLRIAREGARLFAWCHRCGEGGAHETQPTREEVIARLAALRRGDEALVRAAGGRPDDVPLPAVHDVREWPAPFRVWLYKAGLGAHEIAALGAYYNPPSDRVVLPVLARPGGPVVYWQARALGRRQPKYIGAEHGKRECLPTWGTGDVICVTEDILSAFKIGLVGEAVSALGTTPSPRLVRHLLKSGKPVRVWLDPDAAGRRGAAKLIKSLRAYGLDPKRIDSTRDPKLHTRNEIKEYMK